MQTDVRKVLQNMKCLPQYDFINVCVSDATTIPDAEGATYFVAPSALRPKRHSLQEDPKAISSDFMLQLPLYHYSGYYFDH